MTDKQIIIDGCDVSGCSLYEDNPKYRMWGTCDCMRSMVDQSGYDDLAGAECKGYNCYYKQLKRKEQECAELKKWKENVINLFDKTCRCKYLNKESAFCNFYNKECITINQCLYKNQQTLTQIKEIAEKDFRHTAWEEYAKQLKQILQKISEVVE